MNNRPGQPAFTLLEMLVATAMTAVLAGSLYATLHIAFRARRTATRAVTKVRRAEIVLEFMRADIESAVVPRGILAGSFLGEDAIDTAGQPSDTLLLHCTAGASEDTEGTGDIRMVEFACEPAEDGQDAVLLRKVTRNLLATTVEEPEEELLCRGVRSLDILYFDGIDWQETWDSGAQDNVLPRAVEITLALTIEGEEDPYVVTRVYPIPCSSLPPGLEVEAAPR